MISLFRPLSEFWFEKCWPTRRGWNERWSNFGFSALSLAHKWMFRTQIPCCALDLACHTICTRELVSSLWCLLICIYCQHKEEHEKRRKEKKRRKKEEKNPWLFTLLTNRFFYSFIHSQINRQTDKETYQQTNKLIKLHIRKKKEQRAQRGNIEKYKSN